MNQNLREDAMMEEAIASAEISMNTPDTEWEAVVNETLNRLGATVVVDVVEDLTSAYINHKIAGNIIYDLLSFRDTYWKERVRKEVPNALHEYAKWLLENPDAEPLVRRAKKNEIACAITNEDNLK